MFPTFVHKSYGTISTSHLILWLVGFSTLASFTFAASRRATPMKIMIVGDSISQGHEGDWTWRYRLWQWINSQRISVDFVGPYAGTRPRDKAGPPALPPLQGAPPGPTQPAITSGGYAVGIDPRFDRSHWAAWGRQLAQDADLVASTVTKYKPDILLVLLGYNDLAYINDAQGTLNSMQTFIHQARASKPDIRFAISNVPQRISIAGRDDLPVKINQYNSLLADAVPKWNTPTSSIKLVQMRENYNCGTTSCPAGYDGLHPNVLGEYQIAQAFSSTLVIGFGIGKIELDIPSNLPVRPISVPTNIVAKSSPLGVTVTWNDVYGAMGYDIQVRILGQQEWSIYPLGSNRYDTTWAVDGVAWEYAVRTSNGITTKSAWSGVVSAVAHPMTPSSPVNIVTTATPTGVDASWIPASSDSTSFAILTYPHLEASAFISEIGIDGSKRSAHIDSLIPGHHYIISVQAVNRYGGGIPGIGRSVTVGSGTPPPPRNLQIASIDDTTVDLTWCGSSTAAGYHVWVRNINDNKDVLHIDSTSSGDTHMTVAFLFPGVWNYQFCISALNGVLESARSPCLTAPRPGNTIGGPVGGPNCYMALPGSD